MREAVQTDCVSLRMVCADFRQVDGKREVGTEFCHRTLKFLFADYPDGACRQTRWTLNRLMPLDDAKEVDYALPVC
jgi:hypothetical protein